MRVYLIVVASLIPSHGYSAGPQIPQTFSGHWEPSLKSCETAKTTETHEEIEVNASFVTWYEIACELKSVDSSSGLRFKAKFSCSEEGEDSPRTLDLALSKDGRLTVNTGEKKLTGLRCP